MNVWFNVFPVDKPFIIRPKNIVACIRDNSWLFVICCIAIVLHIYPILLPILNMGDEPLHLQGGLLIYDYIDVSWHRFNQIAFWVLLILFLLITKAKSFNKFILNKLAVFSDGKKHRVFICLAILLLISYFYLLRNIPYNISLIRYPPVSKYLYFIMYSAFGISHIFPRIIQLFFYLLCAVYLYRTINLFHEKKTALLGASIYLFLPVIFAYASLGETASGVNFFIFAISFYFIRFLRDEDSRDLLLTAYLIGIGFLYKDPILLMFIICFAFLIVYKIKKQSLPLLIQLKIISLSLVSIIPWMIISKTFNWRNYTFVLSNLISLNGNMVNYFVLIASNLSAIVFTLFILSIIYICFFKRNILTVFFGFLFIVYYFFTVSDMAWLDARFSMTFYPTITVFLSLFISRIFQNIKWRHAFHLCFIIITVYLIVICTVPPLNNRFFTHKKIYYYPSAKAMKWAKENVREGEKILTIRILPFNFYRVKYAIDKNNIIGFSYEIEGVSTPDKLKVFYRDHNLSYIMFPYGPPYSFEGDRKIIKYLRENQNNEFEEVAQFNQDENFIYIYKMKEI